MNDLHDCDCFDSDILGLFAADELDRAGFRCTDREVGINFLSLQAIVLIATGMHVADNSAIELDGRGFREPYSSRLDCTH